MVTCIARNQMYVQMIDGLASSAAVIDADIETDGGILFENARAEPGQGLHQFLLFFGGRIKPGGYMATRNEQSMSLCYGISIPHAIDVLAHINEPVSGGRTKWAGLRHRRSIIMTWFFK
jgi:hypothetical protein